MADQDKGKGKDIIIDLTRDEGGCCTTIYIDDDDDIIVIEKHEDTEGLLTRAVRQEFPAIDEEVARLMIKDIKENISSGQWSAPPPGERQRKKGSSSSGAAGSLISVDQERVLQAFRDLLKEQRDALDTALRMMLMRTEMSIVLVSKPSLPDSPEYLVSNTMGEVKITPSMLSLKAVSASSSWTIPLPMDAEYTLMEAMAYRQDDRILLFHGTRCNHLRAMISTGIQPIGGHAMGRGFYVSADPAVAKTYMQKGLLKEPGVLIQFSMTVTDAQTLRGAHYHRPQGKPEKADFFQVRVYGIIDIY